MTWKVLLKWKLLRKQLKKGKEKEKKKKGIEVFEFHKKKIFYFTD